MNEKSVPQSGQEWPPRKRFYSLAIVLALSGVLGYFSIGIIRVVWPLKANLAWFQVPLLVLATLFLALAVCMLVAPIRRKLVTGKFLLAPDEVARRRKASVSKLGAGKPLGPQLWLWLLPALLSGMLLSFGVGVLVAVNRDQSARGLHFMGFVLGGLLSACGLLYPFFAIRRKLRTGSFLPSQEVLAARRARCAKPRSLRQRATLAGAWIVLAILGTDTAVSRMHKHDHGGIFPPWFGIVVYWLNAGIFTWQLVRPPASQCALPEPPQDDNSGVPQFREL